MSSRAGGSEHTSVPSLPHRVCGGGEKLCQKPTCYRRFESSISVSTCLGRRQHCPRLHA